MIHIKKITTACLFILILLSQTLCAQTQDRSVQYKNNLKINSLSLLLGTGTIFYERIVSDMASWQLGLAYFNYGFTEMGYSAFYLNPELRIFPRNNAGNGFYISPYLRFRNLMATNSQNDKESIMSYGGGVSFGRQWMYDNGFTLDIFFGGHYSRCFTVEHDFGDDPYSSFLFNSVSSRVGILAGFSF